MSTTRPLAGIKVLEIGHSIAAPYAGMILGELGADVIKLENPGNGDYCRGWGPPFSNGAATMFQAMNRAKRGITADLRDEATRARVHRLIIDEMDVVLHNLKPGALDRLGLGSETLLAEKPALICCDMGAFGHVGPLADQPGYDPLMQAFGGLMSILGEDGRPPARVPVSIMDLATGMWTVIGILAAHAERVRTGIGGRVNTSLFETSCAWMSIPLALHMATGALPVRAGSGVTEIVPYQVFPTADGELMVAAGNDNLFRKLCAVLGRDDLAADERYTKNAGRVAHRGALIATITESFSARPLAEWSAKLTAAGIPNGPVQTLDQVVAHPQTQALEIVHTSPDGSLRTVGLPLSFDGVRPNAHQPAPALGEHTAGVLRD